MLHSSDRKQTEIPPNLWKIKQEFETFVFWHQVTLRISPVKSSTWEVLRNHCQEGGKFPLTLKDSSLTTIWSAQTITSILVSRTVSIQDSHTIDQLVSCTPFSVHAAKSTTSYVLPSATRKLTSAGCVSQFHIMHSHTQTHSKLCHDSVLKTKRSPRQQRTTFSSSTMIEQANHLKNSIYLRSNVRNASG